MQKLELFGYQRLTNFVVQIWYRISINNHKKDSLRLRPSGVLSRVLRQISALFSALRVS